jgi:hypothetical protein
MLQLLSGCFRFSCSLRSTQTFGEGSFPFLYRPEREMSRFQFT